MKRPRGVFVLGLVLGLVLGAVAVGGAGFGVRAQDAATPTAADLAGAPAVRVVQQVGPAVVTVINEQTVAGVGTAGQMQPVGSGTGFIIDDRGHIVTNWHVVDRGQQFRVIFADGETRDATLIGADQVSDLAVVQVSGPLPGVVTLGDSAALQPGEPVLAIGSPLGAFTNTVTEGIVSATGRDFPQDQSQGPQVYTNLVQHDAAINPGNSGGPLFTLDGKVVGVNTLGIPTDPQGQPVQGLFFAIPSNTVTQITDQLMATGTVVYPYFGVSTVPVTPDVVAQAKLAADHGVYVADVAAGGPAAAAGIAVGDVILAIDGQTIDAQHSFTEILFAHKPGDAVTARIQRGDQQVDVTVTLGQRPTT